MREQRGARFLAQAASSKLGLFPARHQPQQPPHTHQTITWPPSTSSACMEWSIMVSFAVSNSKTAPAPERGTRSQAPTAAGSASSAARASVGSQSPSCAAVGRTPMAVPEKTGFSSGPVTCSTPAMAPATGCGVGRTPSVARSWLTSTPGTLALSRYSPVKGFRSRSPAGGGLGDEVGSVAL